MSAIDPEMIDVTQPPPVNPTTGGLRSVIVAIKALFTIARSEIGALQSSVDQIQSTAEGAMADAGAAQSSADAAQAAATSARAAADAIVAAQGVPNGFASLDAGSKVVEDPASASATPAAGKIVVADALGRVDPWITDRSWHGVLYAAEGDCDPHKMLREWQMSCSVAGPTPSSIGPSVARCVMFVPPRAMTVARVHLFGVASTSAVYKFAIYPALPGASKLWDSGAVAGSPNTWVSIVYGLPVSLVAVMTTGSIAGFRSRGAPPGSAFWGPGASPLGGRGLLFPEYAQFAVSGGVFPSTLPTVVAATYAGSGYGSVPYALLDSAAS